MVYQLYDFASILILQKEQKKRLVSLNAKQVLPLEAFDVPLVFVVGAFFLA